jgi:ABC-type transporter Mla subunit MlaD
MVGWPAVTKHQEQAEASLEDLDPTTAQIHATLAVSHAIMAASSDHAQAISGAIDRLDELTNHYVQRIGK